ncbi:hypothetical protein [Zavarzinella formosa]|uniref:hypothetical protein n=1 Tax=Zavarzinella formosa TaxID=360055 RepID=UPI0002EE2E67|nr:hypothetical protein [Zavarzinella formosa]
MTAGTPNPTNRWLSVITALCGAGLVGLFLLVSLRRPTPVVVDFEPLRREISDIKTAGDELKKTLQKGLEAAPNKDAAARAAAEANVKLLTSEIARLNAAFESRLKDFQSQQQDAASKGDAARAKELERAIEMQRQHAESVRKELASYQAEAAKAAEARTAEARTAEANQPITLTPNQRPKAEDTSASDDEVVRNILRVGALVLAVTNPELTPIITMIAAELGLFGSDVETRAVYMEAVHDVVEGRPISAETRRRLGEAGRSGKIPPKMVEQLDALIKGLPNGARIRNDLDNGVWDTLNRSSGGMCEDIRKGLKEKRSLEELRRMFPTVDGKPYYPSEKEKREVERMFQTEFFDRISELWEGPQGLTEIPIRKE